MLKNRKIKKWLIGLVVLLGLAGGGYLYYTKAMKTTADNSQETASVV